MPREMERPERGKRRERDAPSERMEESGPERGNIDPTSVLETLSHARSHDRKATPRGDSLPDRRSGDSGDRRRTFTEARPDKPIGPTRSDGGFESQPAEESADTPILDDITRLRETREPAGTAKRKPRLKFTKDGAQPQPAARSGKPATVRFRADYAEAGQGKKKGRTEEYSPEKTSGADRGTVPVSNAKGREAQRKKAKRRLVFEDEAKPGKKRINSSVPLAARSLKAGVGAAHDLAHRKADEAGQENMGVDAAHKGELMAERAVRSVHYRQKRKARLHGGTAKLEQKKARLHAKAAKQKTAAGAAKPKKQGALSRVAQKIRIRRQYAKAAREARKAAQRAKKAGSAAKSAAGFIRRPPVAFLVILLIAMVVIVIVTVVSAFSGIASEGAGAVMSTSYLAPDEDIDAAELAYTEWETDLQIEINNTESTHSGFDEYRYSVDDIGHGPHELMAYLTAVYNDFSFADIETDLRGIFDAQYQLSYTEETETRTQTRTIETGEAIGQVRTTGYCHCSICNGQWAGGPTASGVMPRAGHTIAVDRYNPIVPMGTRVVINGVVYTVEDTGNLNANNSDFDIFWNSHSEALAWGRRNHTAYLAEGSGNTLEITETVTVRVLNINLVAVSFTDVISPRLDTEQTERYSLLTRVKGNRQYAGSPFDFNWLPYVADVYGWRVHPVGGGKDLHKGVDIAVATGTQIIAAHDGTVTFARNSGDYGLAVFIEGDNGVGTRYAGCAELLVTQGQTVKMGDAIAKVGSSGDGSGPCLHFEVMKNGTHLNPLYFAITNDDGSSYIPPGSAGGIAFPDYPGAPMDDARFAAMMAEAQKHLGKPYVFGASGPSSFDCSGFVSYVLSQSVYPGFGRTTAQGLYNICTPVSRANAQPGDLIFFTGTYNAGRPVTHVGVFIGNGQMIHAGKPVQYSSIDTPYWTSHLYAFGRLP